MIRLRILIVTARKPKKRFLVNLHTDDLIDEFKNLINDKKNSQAITSALKKGKVEREVSHNECGVEADLVLTENSARWDLIKD